MTWLAIAIGGALGSMARYAVGQIAESRGLATRFPAGTLAVNLLGCAAIGLLAGLAASGRITMRPPAREFLIVGVLGGFTTFSAFGLETILLSRAHSPGPALLNIAAHVIGGLAAVWIGYSVGLSKPWSPNP